MTATVSTTGYDWQPQNGLQVYQNGYYRFVALFPAGTTQDQAYALLCGSSDPTQCNKWDVKSIEAPPADVTAALQSVLAAFPAASPPVAFWVIGTWLQASGTLPQPDGTFYYEQLALYTTMEGDPVPAPTFTEPTAPAAPPTSETWVVLLAGSALVLGAYFLLRQQAKTPIPYKRARENPVSAKYVQSITTSVNGRPVKFDISTDGPSWFATAAIKAGRKMTITGSGETKANALQQAIARASQAFAQHDVA